MRLSEGLWKVGQCFENLLDKRTRNAAHYNKAYFNVDGAIILCIAFLPQPCDELRSHVIVGTSSSTPSLTLVASANVLMASQQYDGSGGADADATVALLLY